MRGRQNFPIVIILVTFVGLSGSALAQWTKVTNIPPAAYINALTQSGSSIIAGVGDGLYSSTDHGASWQFNALLGNYPTVNALASAGTMALAATSFGIYATTNGGSSWTDISSTIGHTYIQSVGSIDTILLASIYGGVYRSTNKGISWQHSVSDSPKAVVLNFAHIGSHLLAATPSGIFISRDSGQTWTLSSSGLTNLNDHGLSVQGKKIFAGTWGNGVFVSVDSGATWTASNTGMGNRIIENVYATDTVLYLSSGNDNVWVSKDSGSTWTESATLPFGEAHDCVVSGGGLFVATRSGVSVSSNNGTSWTPASTGMNTLNVGGFASSGSNVYIATNYNGVFGSTDGGSTWNTVNGDLPYIPLGYCIAVQGSNLFFGDNSGMHRSTNGGTTWQAANTGFAGYNPVYDFLFSGTSVYSAGSDGVYVSTDSAAHWSPDTTGLPTLYVNRLAKSGTNLYTFPYNLGISKSTNNGSSWADANSGITLPADVYGFAKIDSTLILGTSNGVYRSTNEAGSWTATGQFAQTYTRCLTNVGLYLFTCTQSGLYASGDKGQTWQSVGTGLGIIANGANHFVVSGDYLMIDINNDGVWRRSLADMVPYVSAGVSSVNFPHMKISDSLKVTLSFRNMIGHSLSVSGLSVGHPSVFQLSTTTPFTLAATDSFSVTITCKPSAIGLVSDSLTISYTGGTAVVPVSGYGTGTPAAQIASRNVNFGGVKVGQFKDTTATITNGGNDTLKVSGTSTSGGMFVARNASFKVPPGQSFKDTLRFLPGTAGPANGSFVLTSNSATSPDTILVLGTGISTTGVEATESILPTVYALKQNYPNPFNPSTAIPYDLPARSFVRLRIYNVLGQEVLELLNGEESAGFRSIVWNANVASGIYFYRLEATSLDAANKHFIAVRKLLLLK